jgi:hypothetical protein
VSITDGTGISGFGESLRLQRFSNNSTISSLDLRAFVQKMKPVFPEGLRDKMLKTVKDHPVPLPQAIHAFVDFPISMYDCFTFASMCIFCWCQP